MHRIPPLGNLGLPEDKRRELEIEVRKMAARSEISFGEWERAIECFNKRPSHDEIIEKMKALGVKLLDL